MPLTLPSTASGNLFINGLQYVDGQNLYKGLTERNNANLFSPNPELEFSKVDNVYHQMFKATDIINNDKTKTQTTTKMNTNHINKQSDNKTTKRNNNK